jgi:hypothetical protein
MWKTALAVGTTAALFASSALGLECKWELEITDTNGKKLETKALSSGAEKRSFGPGFECEISKVNELQDGDTKKSGGQARVIECTHDHTNISQEVDCMIINGKSIGYSAFVQELRLKDTKTGDGRWIRLKYSKIDDKK